MNSLTTQFEHPKVIFGALRLKQFSLLALLIGAFLFLGSSEANATVNLTIHNTGCEDMKVYKKDWGWETYQTTITAGSSWSCWTWFNQEFVFRKMNGNYMSNYNCGSSSTQNHNCDSGGCNSGGGTCGNLLAHWNLNACSAGSSYAEFTATTSTPTGFSAVSASILSSVGDHSCNYGQSGEGICHAITDGCSFVNNDNNAYKFAVTINPASGKSATLGSITFYESAPSSYSWVGGGSGDNDPPSKYGVRVTKNGTEIFKQVDIATTAAWSLETIDFAGDADFTVTSQTTFNVELLGYCRQGTGGYAVWDVDEIKAFGCTQNADPCAANDFAIDCERNVNNGGWGLLPDCTLSVCPGDKVVLSVNPNGFPTSWTGPNGITGTSNDLTVSNSITLSQAGAYVATINKNGCIKTKTITVIVNDTDGDGVCNDNDCQPTNPAFPATPGSPCNDGNANTTNDVVTANGCGCAGTLVPGNICQDRTVTDSKESCGTGANYSFFANDLLNGTNENARYFIQNGSFKEYDNGIATFTGTVVNNSNSNIKFAINVTLSGRTLTAPVGSPKPSSCYTINTGNWYYYTSITGTLTGQNTVAGGVLNVSLLDNIAFQTGTGANLNDGSFFGGSSWLNYSVVSHPTNSSITFKTGVQMDFNIRLSGNGGNPCVPCANAGGDTDGDGVCNETDCQPNNPAFPATPGTACNDGNANTTNDVVTANGCGCAGTPVDPCANLGGDTDGDGTCNNNDCQPNNPAFPATPGSPCNDGNANTTNDVVTANGCGCAGTPVIPVCDNITNGGTIGFGTNCQSSASISCNTAAPNIVNCTSPTGGTGALETIWLKSTTSCSMPTTTAAQIIAGQDPHWVWIPGQTGLTLTPGTVSANTCYLRCTRRAGCDTYAESNIISLTTDCGGGSPNCTSGITITTGTGTITVIGLSGAPVSSVQVLTSTWQPQYSCFANCGASQTINVTAGTYYVYAKYYTAGYQLICEKQETVTVGGGNPCVNLGGDTDGDGVCNNNDCQPNNPAFPATPGTTCNDGNANTTNDVVTADGCGCAGTPANNGPNCDTGITITTDTGTITVTGLGAAPVSSVQVLTSTWQSQYSCFANCGASQTINVPAGTYFVYAKYYTAGYQLICEKQATVTVTGGNPCANAGGDTDGDGVCNNNDCQPNNPAFPATPGAACNDGNANTTNDIITADGCGCAGTVPNPCANAGGDTDGDGICNNNDCQPNNAAYPATPGMPCNDGNANTNNDVVTANGCGCAGTPANNCVAGTQRPVTSTNDNCGTWCGGAYALTFGANNCWTAGTDLVFKEFPNGTATLTGTVKKGSQTMTVNVSFTGKTTTAPSNSPHYDLCVSSGGASWYYYTNFSGTIGSYNITKYGPAFQVGTGANLQDNTYGASGWFSYGGSTNGDFNFKLGASSNISGTDSDNDGICDVADCQPNNAAYPATPGTACNDGNTNTTNDVVQADGCSCAGTTGGTGGNHCKIGKRVWHDKNNDGIYNGNDNGIAGCWVNLRDHLGNSMGWKMTDSQGNFDFDNLAPGNYKLAFSTPGGFIPTMKHAGSDIHSDSDIDYWTGLTDLISAVAGQYVDHCDAGYKTGQYLMGQHHGFNFDVKKEMEHTSLFWIHDGGAFVNTYMVERSADGINFEAISEFNSRGGAAQELYEDFDIEPMIGENYYRIAILRVDGNIAYSDVKKVEFADLVDYQLFPNPANGFVNVNLEKVMGKQADIQVFNGFGVRVKGAQLDEIYSKYYQMDLRDLKEGHYIVWINVVGHRPVAKTLVIGRL